MNTPSPDVVQGEQDAAAVDARFFRSLLDADVPALDAVLTDDFLMVDVMRGGEIPRAALVEALTKRAITFDAIELVESRVRRFGPTTVITGRTRMRGHAGARSWSVESRYTHVFVEQHGAWRLASAQGTAIADP